MTFIFVRAICSYKLLIQRFENTSTLYFIFRLTPSMQSSRVTNLFDKMEDSMTCFTTDPSDRSFDDQGQFSYRILESFWSHVQSGVVFRFFNNFSPFVLFYFKFILISQNTILNINRRNKKKIAYQSDTLFECCITWVNTKKKTQ